jgi:cytochrome c-type biogenesis protein CcmH/NrfF
MTLPLAHAGHYLVWVLYALPVLLVVIGIARTTLAERRGRGSGSD